jgi:polyisoprenoid-binding protein YceI
VRSADYLDVEKFPTICVQVEQLEIHRSTTLVAQNGELTMMGVDRGPVTLNVALFALHSASRK